jgi:hypothetical protein
VALSFPVPPTLKQPNWFSEPVFGEAPATQNVMLSGVKSFLRFSDVQLNGKFTVHWDELLDAEVLVFKNFWGQADKLEAFTLPNAFWPTALEAGRRATYESLSPAGFWRFAEKPTIEEVNREITSIIAVFEAGFD